MTAPRSRLLHYKLFVTLVVGVLIPAFAVMGLLRETTRISLSDAFLEKAYLLETHIEKDIELAHQVGVPLTSSSVRKNLLAYFKKLLSSHHEIHFIALTDLDRNLIVFDGTDKAHLGRLLANPEIEQVMGRAETGVVGMRIAHVQNHWVLSRRLEAEGRPFSWLYIAVDVHQADSYFVMQWPNFVAVFLVVFLLLWHVAGFIADKLYHEPKELISMAQRAFIGKKPVYLKDSPEGGEYGYLAHLQNSLLKRLSETYRQLVQDFVDVREAVFDDRVAQMAKHDQEKFETDLGYLGQPAVLRTPIGVYADYRLPILALGFVSAGVWGANRTEEAGLPYVSMTALAIAFPVVLAVVTACVRDLATKEALSKAAFRFWATGVFTCGVISAAAFDVFASKTLLIAASVFCAFVLIVHLSLVHGKWWTR